MLSWPDVMMCPLMGCCCVDWAAHANWPKLIFCRGLRNCKRPQASNAATVRTLIQFERMQEGVVREALGRQALMHNGRAARAEAVTDAQVLPPTHVSGTYGKNTPLSG